MDNIRIQVMFTIANFSDCLYYSLQEWSTVTPEQIETDKQARYQAWLAAVNEMNSSTAPAEG